MSALSRRLSKLEGGQRKQRLSPEAKCWLGLPLTSDEQARLDAGEGTDLDDIDASDLSPEVKQWLGLD